MHAQVNRSPVGYYSNENHENNGGNAVLLDGADNDGPVTEIMDHSLGAERNTNQRFLRVRNQNNNQVNDVSPMNMLSQSNCKWVSR